MTEKPRVPIDGAAFEKLRRIAPNLSAGRRDAEASDWRPRPLPEEIAFKLTNRCDLRCAHCYQWSPDGYHHDLAPAVKRTELDLAIVARVLEYTRPVRSNVFLWGASRSSIAIGTDSSSCSRATRAGPQSARTAR